MDFKKGEIELLGKVNEDTICLKRLIVDNFPKFRWRLEEIDTDKCGVIDTFVDGKLHTKSIMEEGVIFLTERIRDVIGSIGWIQERAINKTSFQKRHHMHEICSRSI